MYKGGLTRRGGLLRDKYGSITRLSLQFFIYSIVEAVLGYAYTGKVELTEESAERIYLLSHNLKCKKLMATCIKFLIPR